MAKQSIPDNEGAFLDKPIQYIKIFGHLNYVFCVCFDRTGDFIFTVNYKKNLIYQTESCKFILKKGIRW